MPTDKKPGTMIVTAQVPTSLYKECRELITDSQTTGQERLNWSKLVTSALESKLSSKEPSVGLLESTCPELVQGLRDYIAGQGSTNVERLLTALLTRHQQNHQVTEA
jgi:hypothetical protein